MSPQELFQKIDQVCAMAAVRGYRKGEGRLYTYGFDWGKVFLTSVVSENVTRFNVVMTDGPRFSILYRGRGGPHQWFTLSGVTDATLVEARLRGIF